VVLGHRLEDDAALALAVGQGAVLQVYDEDRGSQQGSHDEQKRIRSPEPAK
jgi:hypothetical protein